MAEVMPLAFVLASGSAGRKAMLANAGLRFAVDAAHIDEAEVKQALRAEGAPVERATEALAELKARRVSPRHPGMLVLGADSMLECGGAWFDKTASMAEARRQLLCLRDREHRLVTSAVLVKDDTRIWHSTAVGRLIMRDFSEAFLDAYLEAVGEDVCASVGGYRVEGRGLQLFQRIDGDFYAIVGLPMLELLDQLRVQGAVPS